jgi:hypothetical protein
MSKLSFIEPKIDGSDQSMSPSSDDKSDNSSVNENFPRKLLQSKPSILSDSSCDSKSIPLLHRFLSTKREFTISLPPPIEASTDEFIREFSYNFNKKDDKNEIVSDSIENDVEDRLVNLVEKISPKIKLQNLLYRITTDEVCCSIQISSNSYLHLILLANSIWEKI